MCFRGSTARRVQETREIRKGYSSSTLAQGILSEGITLPPILLSTEPCTALHGPAPLTGKGHSLRRLPAHLDFICRRSAVYVYVFRVCFLLRWACRHAVGHAHTVPISHFLDRGGREEKGETGCDPMTRCDVEVRGLRSFCPVVRPEQQPRKSQNQPFCSHICVPSLYLRCTFTVPSGVTISDRGGSTFAWRPQLSCLLERQGGSTARVSKGKPKCWDWPRKTTHSRVYTAGNSERFPRDYNLRPELATCSSDFDPTGPKKERRGLWNKKTGECLQTLPSIRDDDRTTTAGH